MAKVETDQGLGPGSEPRRREMLGLDSGAPKSDKNAETQPGTGKPVRKDDAVDEILEGFGPSRPDQPRILPNIETTPPLPELEKNEITSTEPGRRRRLRNVILATVISFGAVMAFGIAIVKITSRTTPAPSATGATTTTQTTPRTQTTGDNVPPPPTITTMEVESLPTARTATPLTINRTAHTATPPVTSTATATTVTAHPTGSGPPGMSLLPDDPHR
jgi:hypothetical protein